MQDMRRSGERTVLACNTAMGAIGVQAPRTTARSSALPPAGPLANYKNWNRGTSALLTLDWYTRVDGSWCPFDDVEPALLGGYGVFIIWKNGSPTRISAVLYVGRGSLRDEFARCRRDPLFHNGRGLYVTWSAVGSHLLDPVAAYLYQHLRPLWGEVVSFASPMAVNLPLSA
jgi:hypothetical protein